MKGKVKNVEFTNREHILLDLVCSSLWGIHLGWKGHQLSHGLFLDLTRLATQQALVGLVSQGLMDADVRMECREDALNLFALQQSIRRRNRFMDEKVVELCQTMAEAGIRIYVMKGQTLAVRYPDAGLRQSGDIDFLCHPEDWEKAICMAKDELGVVVKDHNSAKHVEWERDGVQYEMHRKLTTFAYPAHQRYWDKVVMREVLESSASVDINGYAVPVLPPTINVLYTFVHIFYHLLIEGIGLRQFCDLAVLMNQEMSAATRFGELDFHWAELTEHVGKLGLTNAFAAVGAVLTDALGLSEECFPLTLSDADYRRAQALIKNVIERGNFGHNVQYMKSHGVIHGMQHLWEMSKQAKTFYAYAPAEALWRIPEMFKWWGIKIAKKIKGVFK